MFFLVSFFRLFCLIRTHLHSYSHSLFVFISIFNCLHPIKSYFILHFYLFFCHLFASSQSLSICFLCIQSTHNPLILLLLTKCFCSWEIDNNYCQKVTRKSPYDSGPRLLDIIDTAVFDFLIGKYLNKL